MATRLSPPQNSGRTERQGPAVAPRIRVAILGENATERIPPRPWETPLTPFPVDDIAKSLPSHQPGLPVTTPLSVRGKVGRGMRLGFVCL